MKLHVEKWYDHYTRSWVIQTKDEKGNQIGEATYVATKPEAEREMKVRKREITRQAISDLKTITVTALYGNIFVNLKKSVERIEDMYDADAVGDAYLEAKDLAKKATDLANQLKREA